ncbi:hypothetical protein BDZ97DRAFT_1669113 [Flammula alnicola]|nr:hypothetical protein BDZ97DRAFT_1669113 [Flammula alnicola]
MHGVDNNCTVAKHVKNDPNFDNVGLAVDVFHFENKHADSDDFCQANCDPAKFPELRGKDGKGWFHSMWTVQICGRPLLRKLTQQSCRVEETCKRPRRGQRLQHDNPMIGPQTGHARILQYIIFYLWNITETERL